ncbi:putative MFS family arabinose efflux permease [Rhizobium sp. BK376]|nr:MFS transporter [Rhizobium sp. BK376]TCR62765.1 putative MFS family arabinose efflux permease [Rhizobium sp. BK376]
MFNFLRKNPDFLLFLLTQAISNMGDSLRIVVMPLLVLQLTGSAIYVSAMALLETATYFLFHLPFGAMLDHADRRRVMLLADIGRGALMLAIPLLWFNHVPLLVPLFLITVLLSILSSLFGAGSNALIPTLVQSEDLTKAYATFEAAESAAWIAGPLVAGALATWFGLASALLVDAGSFLVSAVGLIFIKAPLSKVHGGADPIWNRIVDGFGVLIKVAPLRRIQLYWTLYGIVGYGAITGFLYVGSRGGVSGPEIASFAVSAYALGSVIGTLLAAQPQIAKARHAIPISLLIFAGGAALVGSSWQGGMLGGAFLIGASEGFFLVLYLARRADATPDGYMARIGSIAAMLARLASGISITWMGIMLDRWHGPGAFSMMAVLGLFLAGTVLIGDRESRTSTESAT